MRPAPVLFTSMFAAQAAFMTLSPVLPAMARDLELPVSTVGQLGTAAGLAGAATALAIIALGTRASVRALLVAGLSLIALGSLVTAVAPSFACLLVAQLALGAGTSAVMAGAIAAVPAWAPPARRPGVLSWALIGQPIAWVVGMPVIGVVAGGGWRLAWLAVPFAAGVTAVLLALLCGGRGRPAAQDGEGAWRRPAVRRWMLGEMLGFVAWNGTLLYAGGMLAQVHGLRAGTIGLVLGAAALAYLPGVWVTRPHVAAHARPMFAAACVVAAALAGALVVAEHSLVATIAIIVALMAVNGTRALTGSALGLATAPDRSVQVTGMRAAASQSGSLLGAALGGLALDVGGTGVMTALFAALFGLAGLVHVHALRSWWDAHRDPRPGARGRPAARDLGRPVAGAAGATGG